MYIMYDVFPSQVLQSRKYCLVVNVKIILINIKLIIVVIRYGKLIQIVHE